MARPKKVIDPKQVESLAGINCTVDEIAAVIGCDKRTLERRFAANIKRGREHGRSSLRRMMYEKAKEGNVTMMIWLSKQLLGYTDKVEQKNEHTGSDGSPIQSAVVILPSNGREVKKIE